MKKKRILQFTLILCILVFALSLTYTGYILFVHLNQRKIETSIADMWEAGKQQSPAPEATPVFNDDTDDTPLPVPEESEKDKELRLLLEAEAAGRLRHSDILEINPDFLGMIEIPGVIAKQPYVMSHDNEEYLKLDFNGSRSPTGTIFLSMYNNRLLTDNNSTFFGHYTDTGSMFAKLLSFKSAHVLSESPVIILDSLIGESVWVIFSVHVVEPEPWWMIPYPDEYAYAEHLEELRIRSLFITDVDITASDRIITLAVCDYTYEDMRFVVHARRLRPDEVIPESISAEPNPGRKDFTIPHQTRVNDADMSGAAVAVNPFNNRLFYFKPDAGGIERYSGGTDSIQGPFRVLDNSGISAGTDIAAIIVSAAEDADARAVYLAAQDAGGMGLILFTSYTSTGMLRPEGLVTPDGIGARYPFIQNIDGTLWLFYTVTGEGGTSDIYRQHIRGGEPEHLFAVHGVSDARALGLYALDGISVLVWHSPSDGFIYAAQPGSDKVYNIDNTGAGKRTVFYGPLAGSSVSCVIESEGKLSFGSVNLGVIAQPPADIID